ncbi:MAG TPA: hypothetical protein PK092_04390 [Chitinophagaceae bacterium]|nr:hypothetical protein [Chitinophagaceae bacterium]
MTAFLQLPLSVYVKLLIAFAVVIIFCRWLVKRMIKAGKSKAHIMNAKRLIYAGFAYAAFVWLVFTMITFEKQTKFKRNKWIAERNERYKMADDLIQSGIITGKDSNEVKALIGEPDLRNVTSQIWNYNMDNGGEGFCFSIHYLVVEFMADSVSNIWHQMIAD